MKHIPTHPFFEEGACPITYLRKKKKRGEVLLESKERKRGKLKLKKYRVHCAIVGTFAGKKEGLYCLFLIINIDLNILVL
jgi:hypothetical protein